MDAGRVRSQKMQEAEEILTGGPEEAFWERGWQDREE